MWMIRGISATADDLLELLALFRRILGGLRAYQDSPWSILTAELYQCLLSLLRYVFVNGR
jgi:hypothetical protein